MKENFYIFCYHTLKPDTTLQFHKIKNDNDDYNVMDNNMKMYKIKLGDTTFNIDKDKMYNFYLVAENNYGFSAPSNEISLKIVHEYKSNIIDFRQEDTKEIEEDEYSKRFKRITDDIKRVDCAENIYNKNLEETKDTHILRPNMLNKYVGKEIELNL